MRISNNYCPTRPYELKKNGESVVRIFFFEPQRFRELYKREKGYFNKSKSKKPREILLFMDWCKRMCERMDQNDYRSKKGKTDQELFELLMKHESAKNRSVYFENKNKLNNPFIKLATIVEEEEQIKFESGFPRCVDCGYVDGSYGSDICPNCDGKMENYQLLN